MLNLQEHAPILQNGLLKFKLTSRTALLRKTPPSTSLSHCCRLSWFCHVVQNSNKLLLCSCSQHLPALPWISGDDGGYAGRRLWRALEAHWVPPPRGPRGRRDRRRPRQRRPLGTAGTAAGHPRAPRAELRHALRSTPPHSFQSGSLQKAPILLFHYQLFIL